MKIGVPREIKNQEHRVGLVPSSVKELCAAGHAVLVESNAGAGINFSDEDYIEAGAKILKSPQDIFQTADMIIKVKEPQLSECEMLRQGQILFTYLHLAAVPDIAQALLKSGCIAIAYETVMDMEGRLPLLAPMSEVAGRLSVQAGAHYLQKHKGGCGRLISGVPGVKPAKVVILGGGVAGFNAARVAVGMEASVTVLERHPDRMRFLDDYFKGRVEVVYSNIDIVERIVPEADLVIGAVLIPGGSAPKLVSREMLKTMKPGTVMVDIAIDQGGCFETSRPTTHEDPIYVVDDIVHYCVANMPGGVPLTSALALNHAILPYAMKIAEVGWQSIAHTDPGFRAGLNVVGGQVTHPGVARALNLPYCDKI